MAEVKNIIPLIMTPLRQWPKFSTLNAGFSSGFTLNKVGNEAIMR
ncbi:hypothetical protein [Sphingomonas sp. CARO-RG-8B-R24-01]|nr:hypothetical protein [Sphingomonas sp. CARO-RG-8B-R24-01]